MREKSEMALFKVAINHNFKHEFLRELSSLNNIHIQTKKDSEIKPKSTGKEPSNAQIKSLRQNLVSLYNKLDIKENDLKDLRLKEEERMEFIVSNLHELISRASDEINFYLNRINELERYINRAAIELENLKLIKASYTFLEEYYLTRESMADLKQLDFKAYTTFTKNLEKFDSLFNFDSFPNIHQIETNFQIEDRIAFFIFYPRELEEELKERINIIHAEEVPILKKYLTDEGINFTRINNEMNIINDTLVKYEHEKEIMRNQNISKFAAINEVLQNIEEYIWAENQFTKSTKDRLLLQFYTPIRNKKQVKETLIEKFKDNIVLDTLDILKTKNQKVKMEKLRKKERIQKSDLSEEEISDDKKTIEMEKLKEKTPTIMRNSRIIRPFEALTRLYGVPTYAEIDPTPFLAITFPLLFGLMFGDMGHGLVLIISGLIGAFVFRKKKGDIKNYSWIVFYCGIAAVFWGYFYGAFFGTEEFFGIPLNPLSFTIPFIGRVTLQNILSNAFTIFLFMIFVGVIHINIGWFIQFLNYWRKKKKYLAMSDSLMKIFLLTGGMVLIFNYGFDLDVWLSYPYPILLVLLPGILVIILKPIGRLFRISYLKEESIGSLMAEGTIDTFETVLSILSNVLSYIRLLALSLVHITLMLAIITMTEIISVPLITPGMEIGALLSAVGLQILRVVGLIFGNLVVILLEGLLAFINSLRLHFYEFFSKFYTGTGIDFFPFYLNNEYSIIKFRPGPTKDLISEEIAKEIETERNQEELDKATNLIKKEFF